MAVFSPAECWQRSASISFPHVWKIFNGFNSINGNAEKFWIQDIPESMYETVIELMTIHFYANDPIRKCIEFSLDPVSIKEEQELWRRALKQRLSLVCLVKKAKIEITAVSINGLCTGNDAQPKFQGDKISRVALLSDYIIGKNNIYKELDISELVIGIGIVIPCAEYDGYQIGLNILECRSILGESIGIKMKFSIVSSGASQKLLAIAGYKPHTLMSYDELLGVDKRFFLPGIGKYGYSIQLLYK